MWKILNIILLSAFTASGAVYYVDPVDGDDTNDGTATNAAWLNIPGTRWMTAGSGWSALDAGDSLIIRGGVTNLNKQVQVNTTWFRGSAQYDSIVIQSGHLTTPPWGATAAIYDGELSATNAFWITGNAAGTATGITLDGFEIRNIAAGGVGVGADSSKGSCGIWIGTGSGIAGYAANWITVRNCWIHDCLRTTDDQGHGIESNGAGNSTNYLIHSNIIGPNIGTKGIEAQRIHWGVISNNFVYGMGDHGIVITGTNWDIVNNYVRLDPPFVHSAVHGIKLNYANNAVFNNLVVCTNSTFPTGADHSTVGIGIFGNGTNALSYSNVIAFNTVYNSEDTSNGREYGVGISVGNELTPAWGNTIVGNLSMQNKNANGGIAFFMYGGATSNTWLHNACWNTNYTNPTNCVATFYVTGGITNLTIDQFNASSWSNNMFSGNVRTNPAINSTAFLAWPTGLTTARVPNTLAFALSSSTPQTITTTASFVSPATHIGYSSDPTKYAYDILGVPRVLWSVGAYEYSPIVIRPLRQRWLHN